MGEQRTNIQCFFVEPTGQVRKETKTYFCEECKENHSYELDEEEYRRTDTGETRWCSGWPTEFGVGVMFYRNLTMQHEGVTYKGDGNWNNDDGRHLFVLVPEHHLWDIDTRCSNCASPDDRMHRCWVRHGVPPNITVDKNGYTCNVGAGSIWANQGAGKPREWHGVLQNGILIEC